MAAPEFLESDKAFVFLRKGDLESYNREVVSRGGKIHFTNANLRGVDFRSVDTESLYLTACYLRDADLRGCDIRHWDLEGTSLHNAHISGTYFPDDVEAEEIRLSVDQGIRIRTRVNHRVVVGQVKKKPAPPTNDPPQPEYDR